MEEKNELENLNNLNIQGSSLGTTGGIIFTSTGGSTIYTGGFSGYSTTITNTIPNPMYNIGDEVYHITPESDPGYILDIKYSYRTNSHEYLVTFSPILDGWYVDAELSYHKKFRS